MNRLHKELLEAARQVMYFDGPTDANLARLREAINASDEAERSFGYTDEDKDEEEGTEL